MATRSAWPPDRSVAGGVRTLTGEPQCLRRLAARAQGLSFQGQDIRPIWPPETGFRRKIARRRLLLPEPDSSILPRVWPHGGKRSPRQPPQVRAQRAGRACCASPDRKPQTTQWQTSDPSRCHSRTRSPCPCRGAGVAHRDMIFRHRGMEPSSAANLSPLAMAPVRAARRDAV